MSEAHVILYTPSDKSVVSGDLDLLDRWDEHPEAFLWLDIVGEPSEFEHALLEDRLGISKLALQDAHRERHPPKFESFDSYLFLILRDLITAYEDSDPDVGDLAIFVGKKFVITRHFKQIPCIDGIREKVMKKPSLLQAGPGHLIYQLSRRIIDAYTPEVLALEELLSKLEDEVYESGDDAVIESLSRYNRALKRLRRHLVYQCNVMAQLGSSSADLPIKLNRHEFNDLQENLDRLASLCQLNQELAVDLLNTHLSLISHRLNQVMRVLTIATVIFLPLGLLAGIYGMNFGFMPELGWHYGYFVVLGAMATVATTLIVIFKRRGWL